MIETMGECAPRFARVRDAFRASLAGERELGGALAITIGGESVVDLWGGFADKARRVPWGQGTLVNVYSTTKGWIAACAHRLVDKGRLELEAPVASYWPEFAQAGKEGVRVSMLLDHTAGLPALREPLPPEAIFDWERMTSALAAEAPWWEPGTKHGYHAYTFGWLVGEVIRRAAGVTPGTYFRESFAGPLGLDAHIGLPEADDARCAELRAGRRTPGEPPTLFDQIMAAPTSMTARAFTNPLSTVETSATRAWRGAEIPAVNGHATARAIARLYGALACGGELGGVRVLSPASIARCSEERARGVDAVLGVSVRFGPGFMLSQPGDMLGPNARAFGHPGAGGSLGFADPDARVGFGYVTNRMGTSILLDPRARALIEAFYASM